MPIIYKVVLIVTDPPTADPHWAVSAGPLSCRNNIGGGGSVGCRKRRRSLLSSPKKGAFYFWIVDGF